MNRPTLWRWLTIHWGSLVVFALASLIAIFALWWIGYDFSYLDDATIGDQRDTVLNTYNVYQALDNLLHRPTDPGYSTIFYGERASFGYTIAPYGLAVFVLPLYVLTGQNLILTYNLYLVATFPLTAWTAYLLARYLVGVSAEAVGDDQEHECVSFRATVAAILVGLMVAFAPFRFLHLAQPEMISTQFFLFALYAFHRLLDAPGGRWAAIFTLSFWFLALTSGYLAAIFAVVGVIMLAYLLLRTGPRVDPAIWRWFAVSAVAGALLLLPLVGFRAANERFMQGWETDVIRQYAAEPKHWLVGYSQAYFDLVPSAGEATLFLGFTPLVLAGIAWWQRNRADRAQRDRIFSGREIIVLYALVCVAGYGLTLGPVLTIDGREIVATPFALLMQLPVFSGMRVPARFIMLPLTGTAILSTFSLVWLQCHRRPVIAWGGLAVVAAILTLEFVPYNGYSSSMISRAFYRRLHDEVRHLTPVVYPDQPVYGWLARETGGAVLHLPFDAYEYYAFQPRHNRPMLNGIATYMPDWATDLDWTLFPSPDTMKIVQDHEITYVLVHDDLLDAASRATFDIQRAAWESGHAPWEYVGRFGEVDVYALPR
jgi:hypothetical protein